MPVALYRKYRSKSLDEIVGQTHVTDVLRRALAVEKIAHAYLLTGPRGVGKTSIARILAHEINELEYSDDSEHLDIIEIDAASNNGVDDVRELREKALIAPASAKKKVYIIDEVHMLSKPAFNALLKILEEPPAHIVFILATTDFDKLPDTIVSRTQRYHFHTISQEKVTAHLTDIAKKENIQIEPAALAIIAARGGGSLRDSLSLLDQIQNSSDGSDDITTSDVERALGLATQHEIASLIAALLSANPKSIISHSEAITSRGVSAVTLASQLTNAITAQLAERPALVALLEGLMEVPKSSHPSTKLLVTLLSQATIAKPKTVAQIAHIPVAPVVATPLPAPASPKVTQKTVAKKAAANSEPAPMLTPKQMPTTPTDLSKFDWDAVLARAKTHHAALNSILSKCTAEVQGEKVVLYAGRKFNKTKLDSAKYRPILGQIIAETGAGSDVHLEILGETAPPKDAQAAKIAAMMGGGEEVDVE